MDIENLRIAYHRGARAAARNVKGYTFVGASPEAIAAGYAPETPEYAVFLTAFLRFIKRPIVTDANNVLQ